MGAHRERCGTTSSAWSPIQRHPRVAVPRPLPPSPPGRTLSEARRQRLRFRQRRSRGRVLRFEKDPSVNGELMRALQAVLPGQLFDLRSGSVQKETRSVKDLLVRPYLPRFFREGDQAELKVVVNNAADHELSGELPDGRQGLPRLQETCQALSADLVGDLPRDRRRSSPFDANVH